MEGRYNWRQTLINYASISAVLAGFCVTFIALILSGKVANDEIPTSLFSMPSMASLQSALRGLTYGEISVLFFGVSTGLFICSSELFLLSKEYDVFSLPKSYKRFLRDNVVKTKEKWKEFEDVNTKQCRLNEELGRNIYNSAIFIIFLGLLFVLIPYNLVIAVIVFSTGIILESWQMVRR